MAADRAIGPGSSDQEAVPVGAAFCLFETAIGSCAIAWAGSRIIRTFLPEATDAMLRRRTSAALPGVVEREPPQFVLDLIGGIRALLLGDIVDFAGAPLDFGGAAPFERRVWQATAGIPPGETRSYGGLAEQLGAPGAARAVGRALGRNPFPIVVPCHRVLGSGGRSGGFSAPGGASTKMRMLAIENARRGPEPLLFDRLAWSLRP
jgi:methylated-DNA-[protein]-cysteine S-methyltransferase